MRLFFTCDPRRSNATSETRAHRNIASHSILLHRYTTETLTFNVRLRFLEGVTQDTVFKFEFPPQYVFQYANIVSIGSGLHGSLDVVVDAADPFNPTFNFGTVENRQDGFTHPDDDYVIIEMQAVIGADAVPNGDAVSYLQVCFN